jgi:L-seryl-tRNA(Ser) seleniumtransferase
LREIPSVEEVLNWPSSRDLAEDTSRKFLTDRVRDTLAAVRQEIRDGRWPAADALAETLLAPRVRAETARALEFSLRPVINATGVILHTNLGRAPLEREALERAVDVAAQYSNLEYDLDEGRRGERDVHVRKVVEALLGAPASIVVNNNAAAVLITLNTLAEGGEVIVSRGELIEIGGSFRIPEIMVKSGAVLREVGTTNRTRIADYRNALNERTRLLLRVHPSNFRVIGFTERPGLDEVVALGRETGVPVFEDLGSGCLVSMAEHGIPDEPPAGASIAAGVDVVSFSGDKMLGGPQAGVIAGRRDLVERIRRNPLFRAMRVDKLTYAVLEVTLRNYWLDRPERIPAIRMIRATRHEIEQRAVRLIAACGQGTNGSWSMELADGQSVLGGGSAPGHTIPTRLVALRHAKHSSAALEKRLRAWQPPVIARVEEDAVLLDLRTVLPEQEEILIAAVRSVGAG